MNQQTIKEGKTLAIVCYFTFVGALIAIFLNLEKKNPFTSFHVRQMVGLIIMVSLRDGSYKVYSIFCTIDCVNGYVININV